ncbi:MAG TPA: M67 family metallopeptidase [Acidimicrobiales bacterium]|nr:M67 family metallopeptidase [Acidimicrobiales bacterium]
MTSDALRLDRGPWQQMLAHAYDGLPLEACGLMLGRWGRNEVTQFVACANAEQSSRIYRIDDREYLAVERAADDAGLAVVGVMHSHTHTEAYPSPTDISIADPAWHYVIVSLRQPEPVLRSYRIEDGTVTEEPVDLLDR